MGNTWAKMSLYFKTQEARVLIWGLDAAGKTTILYVTKLGEVVTTIPTIGFNVETIKFGKLSLTAWDVGGRDKIRPLWRHYYANTSGIIFVVDSIDRERFDSAAEELHKMLREDELRELPVLIFANKQDLPNPANASEIMTALKLDELDKQNRKWHIQPSSAVNKQGIMEGFKWLSDTMMSKQSSIEPVIETIKDTQVIKSDLLNNWSSLNFKTLISKFI